HHFHTDHPVFSCSKIEQKQLNTWVSFQSAEQPLLGQFSVSGNKHGLQLGSLIRIRFDVDEREQCAAKRLLVSLQPDAALSAIVESLFWPSRDVDKHEGLSAGDEFIHFRAPGAAVSVVDACAVEADDGEIAGVVNFRLLGHDPGLSLLTS
ncbi:hypothetical protein ACIUY0_22215, partial [Pseudomonas aeruginosa]